MLWPCLGKGYWPGTERHPDVAPFLWAGISKPALMQSQRDILAGLAWTQVLFLRIWVKMMKRVQREEPTQRWWSKKQHVKKVNLEVTEDPIYVLRGQVRAISVLVFGVRGLLGAGLYRLCKTLSNSGPLLTQWHQYLSLSQLWQLQSTVTTPVPPLLKGTVLTHLKTTEVYSQEF